MPHLNLQSVVRLAQALQRVKPVQAGQALDAWQRCVQVVTAYAVGPKYLNIFFDHCTYSLPKEPNDASS